MEEKTISVWILGDQLLVVHPALAAAEEEVGRDHVRVVMVESRKRTQRLPYHRKKLVLLFSAMRHYAATLRKKGFTVDYIQADSTAAGLKQHVAKHRPARLFTMAASAYGGRQWQQTGLPLAVQVPVNLLANQQFLVERFNPYPQPEPGKRYLQEYFYRQMRQHFDILMAGDEPAGGQWNYDKDNRKPLPADVEIPEPITFAPDTITQNVIKEISKSGHGIGSVKDFNLAVTNAQAKAALHDFVENRLPLFGPYEDAMTGRSRTLFHSLLSPYVNLGLLTPLQMINAVLAAYEEGQAPINSVEGFVRQVLGWREFMYWQYWRQMPDLLNKNDWQATRPVPAFMWSSETDLHCLQQTLTGILQDGYAHHIERLMLLSNFFMLAGVVPAEANEWFLSCFIDAYDWVMAPNVMGMGLNADGGLTATKPYIASANYINNMSDYCQPCRYQHKQRTGADACPFNFLYWNFLLKHEEKLRTNPRLGRNVLGLRYLDDEERTEVRKEANTFLDNLEQDETLPHY